MEQSPAAAQAGWQAAYDAALALDDVAQTDRAALINQLGSATFYAGGREEALASFQEASDIFEQAGPDHLEALEQSLGNVASILGALGRLDEAEAAHRQVLDIRRELYPENHVQIARSYFELGVILNARGDIDGAIALVERSLEIRAAVLEDGHPHIAMTQVSLAAILIRAYRHGLGEDVTEYADQKRAQPQPDQIDHEQQDSSRRGPGARLDKALRTGKHRPVPYRSGEDRQREDQEGERHIVHQHGFPRTL